MRIGSKNIIAKCLVFSMALLILNQSIDAIDFHPFDINNDVSNFNDINSATEYISEIILGHKNAFPESQTKSQHHKSQTLKHSSSLKIFQPQALVCSPKQFITVVTFAYPLDETYSFLFSKDITPPPPKA